MLHYDIIHFFFPHRLYFHTSNNEAPHPVNIKPRQSESRSYINTHPTHQSQTVTTVTNNGTKHLSSLGEYKVWAEQWETAICVLFKPLIFVTPAEERGMLTWYGLLISLFEAGQGQHEHTLSVHQGDTCVLPWRHDVITLREYGVESGGCLMA